MAEVSSSRPRIRTERRSWPLDALVSTPLAGTDGGTLPFWSPDGRFIGFFAEGKIKKVGAGGGPPQTIGTEAPDPRGATWNRDDVIVFAPERRGPLFRVSVAGGPKAPATVLDPRHDVTHRHPHFLPDSRHFVFTAVALEENTSGTFLGTLDSPEVKRLSGDVSLSAYAPPGFLFFVRDTALMAQSFDPRRLAPTGEPEVLAQPAWNDFLSRWGWAGLSAQADVVAYRDGSPERCRLTWLDREGRVTGTVGEEGAYSDLALSPDGRRLALSIAGAYGPSALWVRDLERNTLSRLSADNADTTYLAWSPRGDRIAFSSTRTGTDGLFVQATDGSDSPALLVEKDGTVSDDWSPDGRVVLCEMPGAETKSELWTVPVSAGGKPERFLATPFSESTGRFSSDGRFVAYVSDETGRLEVYVRPFPAGTERWQISTEGGWFPEWRRQGGELYYLSSRSEIMAVEVRPSGSRLAFGSPRRLFETTLPKVSQSVLSANNRLYTVTADGQRFLVMAPVTDPAQNRIAVIVNWAAALKH